MERNSNKAEGIFGARLSKEEAEERIKSDKQAYDNYLSFPEDFKRTVLGFFEGENGVPLLYDNFFRKIFDAVNHRGRVERLISTLIGQQVKIKEVLTREGSQLSDMGSLVIMDIIVELEDGSYVDVEMQKQGYLFPAQRSSCYAADMIMRQYNRKKAEKEKAFSYKDISTVYLFVIMEHKPKEFQGSKHYIHKREVSYSSGVKLPDITRITYITLDTFNEKSDNEDDNLNSWLTLLTKTDMESITKLVDRHPEFADIYREMAEFKKNPKELIGMFSQALYEMDKATERYMVEVLQDDVNKEKERADKAEERADKEKDRADKAEAEVSKYKAFLDAKGIKYDG